MNQPHLKAKYNVINTDFDKSISIIESIERIQYQIPFIIDKKTIDLEWLHFNKNSNSNVFSLVQTNDQNFNLHEDYTFTVISKRISNNALFITLTSENKTLDTKLHITFNRLEIGQIIKAKIISIFGDKVNLKILPINKYITDEIVRFKIKNIETKIDKNNKTYAAISGINQFGSTHVIHGQMWQYINQNKIEFITAIYNEDGGFKQKYNLNSHPALNLNHIYKITLIEEVKKDEFHKFRGKLDADETILIPIPLVEKIEIGKEYTYVFKGVHEFGNLKFRPFVLFEDIIESRALKIVAFENLRRIPQNENSLFTKLFTDYSNGENLWVISYANALSEYIDHKILNSEYTLALIFLEVLEKIEGWILNSNFITYFSLAKQQEISKFAELKLNECRLKIDILKIIEANQEIEYLTNTITELKNPDFIDEFKISVACRLLQYTRKDIPTENQFNLIQILISRIDKIESKHTITNVRNLITSILYKAEFKVRNKVFISPKERQLYYNSQNLFKSDFFASLSLFYLSQKSLNNLMAQYYFAKCCRIISCMTNDFVMMQKSISFAFTTLTQDLNFPEITSLISTSWSTLKITDIEILFDNYLNQIIVQRKPIIENVKSGGVIEIEVINKGVIGYNCKNAATYTAIIPFNWVNYDLKLHSLMSCTIRLIDESNNILYLDPNPNLINQNSKITLQSIAIGDIIPGVVKAIEQYGIFFTIGPNLDGLMPKLEISDRYEENIQNTFYIGDKIMLKIIKIEENKITLSRKRLFESSNQSAALNFDSIYRGKIKQINENDNLIIELENGAFGRVPYNHASWNKIPSLSELFQVNDVINFKIIRINHKEHQLSLKIGDNPINNEIVQGGKYNGKIIAVYDLERTLAEYNIKLTENLVDSHQFCPKCVDRERKLQKFTKSTQNIAKPTLEISRDKKSWSCNHCNYNFYEIVIIKFIKYPVTAYFRSPSNIKLKENILGEEIEFEVDNIIDKKYIRAIPDLNALKSSISHVISSTELTNINFEVASIYEQLSYIDSTLITKTKHLELAKYFYGFANSPKSYFYSNYITFIEILVSLYLINENASLEALKDTCIRCINNIKTNSKTNEIFPIITIIEDLLILISLIGESTSESIENLVIQTKSDNPEISTLAKTILAHNLISDNPLLSSELKALIIEKYQNTLRLFDETLTQDKNIIEKQKEVINILKFGNENKIIECKATISAPAPSKSDYSKISLLKTKLIHEQNPEIITQINNQIFKLENPVVENREIVKEINKSFLKTIVAFANSEGGLLIIGIIEDEKGMLKLYGIDKDILYHKNKDGIIKRFDELFETHIGNQFIPLIDFDIVTILGIKEVILLNIKKSDKPVFLKLNSESEFYIRRLGSSIQLKGLEAFNYQKEKFK